MTRVKILFVEMACPELFFLVILGLTYTHSQTRNNVCKTVEDYVDNINKNPNCWFDSDLGATPEQIARNHGLSLERHSIKTEDKHILTTFRIKSLTGVYGKEVMFLQHGLGTDALSFMLNGNKSLAFFLFGQGYDVWLGNYRGSEFSQHEFLSKRSSQYWNFCVHEHGIYDLAANFKYINEKTKKRITYLGHSMGGTGFGIYASTKPDESEKYIKHAILLAPAFYLRSTKGVLQFSNSLILSRLGNLINTAIPINVLLGTNSFETQAINRICFASLEDIRLCVTLIGELMGKLGNTLPPEKLPLSLGVFRNMGIKDLFHYFQMIQSLDFRMFDYGPAENFIRYKSLEPPSYKLSNIGIPLTWIYAEYDNIVSKSGVFYAFNKFRKENWSIYGIPYSHLIFLLDLNADKTAYPILLKIINKYE